MSLRAPRRCLLRVLPALAVVGAACLLFRPEGPAALQARTKVRDAARLALADQLVASHGLLHYVNLAEPAPVDACTLRDVDVQGARLVRDAAGRPLGRLVPDEDSGRILLDARWSESRDVSLLLSLTLRAVPAEHWLFRWDLDGETSLGLCFREGRVDVVLTTSSGETSTGLPFPADSARKTVCLAFHGESARLLADASESEPLILPRGFHLPGGRVALAAEGALPLDAVLHDISLWNRALTPDDVRVFSSSGVSLPQALEPVLCRTVQRQESRLRRKAAWLRTVDRLLPDVSRLPSVDMPDLVLKFGGSGAFHQFEARHEESIANGSRTPGAGRPRPARLRTATGWASVQVSLDDVYDGAGDLPLRRPAILIHGYPGAGGSGVVRAYPPELHTRIHPEDASPLPRTTAGLVRVCLQNRVLGVYRLEPFAGMSDEADAAVSPEDVSRLFRRDPLFPWGPGEIAWRAERLGAASSVASAPVPEALHGLPQLSLRIPYALQGRRERECEVALDAQRAFGRIRLRGTSPDALLPERGASLALETDGVAVPTLPPRAVLLPSNADPTRLRNALAYDLFRTVDGGGAAPEVSWVSLSTNGVSCGVWEAMARLRDAFPTNASVYRVRSAKRLWEDGAVDGAEALGPASLGDLRNLVDLVVHSSSADFARRAAEVFDLDNLVANFLFLNFMGSPAEQVLVRDGDGRWRLSLWDCDDAFDGDAPEGDVLSNALFDRCLADIPGFRGRVGTLARTLREGLLSDRELEARIGQAAAKLAPAMERGDGAWTSEVLDLRIAARRRAALLEETVARWQPPVVAETEHADAEPTEEPVPVCATEGRVVLSEVMANNGGALRTADGRAADWLELTNLGEEPVDVSGWRLTDDPEKPWRKWKTLPRGSIVPAHGCLVVWADGRSGRIGDEVHVDVRLSAGETLALARIEGDMASRLEIPDLPPDVSYGVPFPVKPGDPVAWNSLTNAVGFAGTPGVFTCRQINMKVGLGDVNQAEKLLQEPENWALGPLVKTYQTICFREDGSGRQEAVPYPGNASFSHERDQMVIEATGIVEIPSAGPWTFACCSDDGCRLTLTGRSGAFTLEYPGSRGYAPTIQTFAIPEPGLYAVRLVYFQGGGGAACDVSVARGARDRYDESDFKLLGHPASGIVHAEAPKEETTGNTFPRTSLVGEEQKQTKNEQGDASPVCFRYSSPGFLNGASDLVPRAPAVAFSVPHGYRSEPADVALSCEDGSDATIFYTLDGSAPTEEHGTRYTAPLRVEHSTCIRAAALVTNAVRRTESTATYLFLDDILGQGANPPPGFPASGAVKGCRFHYAMSQNIVNGPDRERLLSGFTNAVATLSIIVDLPDFFHPDRGIYVNPGAHGRAWERPVRLEQIDPVHGAVGEFQAPAGIRIRGAASRGGGNPKHSFRLFFRDEYGASKLRFPLFGAEGAAAFDKVDLRCSQNYSWAQNGGHADTLVHEVFSRDCQRDLGQAYTRSRFLHVFLNGVYWGLYQTQERAEAAYGETYFGGDRANWDALKFPRGAVDGTKDAYNAFWHIAIEEGFGPEHPENYMKVRGRNPDGTRNPEYPVYLNTENLMAYVLSNHYMVDYDSPVSRFGGWVNNLVVARDRSAASAGFLWFRHDAEHSLGIAGSGAKENCLAWGEEGKFRQQHQFNPCTLHSQLMKDPAYHKDFEDYVQRTCFGDGAMTTTNCILRFRARMAEIDDAVVCEAARWGQQNQTRETWLKACDKVIDNFLAQRLDFLLQQYREKGWITIPEKKEEAQE